MEYFAHAEDAAAHSSDTSFVLITVVWAAAILGILALVVLALRSASKPEPVKAKKPATKSSKE